MSFIRRIKKGDKVYLAEVESRRMGGKVVQRFIRYVGKEANGRTVLSTSMSDVEVEEVKLYGPLLVLHHLATEVELPELLGEYSQEILSLVYAHCLDYRSISCMPHWFERTDLNFLDTLMTNTSAVRAGIARPAHTTPPDATSIPSLPSSHEASTRPEGRRLLSPVGFRRIRCARPEPERRLRSPRQDFWR